MMDATASLPDNNPYTEYDPTRTRSIVRNYGDLNFSTPFSRDDNKTESSPPIEPKTFDLGITTNIADIPLESIDATVLEIQKDFVKVELAGNSIAIFPIELFSNCDDLQYGKSLKYQILSDYFGRRYQKFSSTSAIGLETEKAKIRAILSSL